MSLIRLSKLDAYRIGPLQSIREAMERLNSGDVEYKFQIVCDGDGRLLGTLTDGDIRRALLRGLGVGDLVRECMKDEPVTGQQGLQTKNEELLRTLMSQTAFLPVVDEYRIVREVLVRKPEQTDMIGLVMAGGRGSRLGERTRSKPKPLLPLGDKPILEHVLGKLEAANVTRIYVSTHYLADQILDFVETRSNHAPIETLQETKPLGTAGAIGMLPDPMPVPFMVLNGDVVTKLDLDSFQEFHERHDYDATIAVAQHRVTVPYGVVRASEDGQFLGIEEKPTLTHYVAAGIYLLSPAFRALVRKGERLDMPDLLERGRQIGLRTGLFPIHEYWADVGRPEDLEDARQHNHREQQPKGLDNLMELNTKTGE